MDRVSSSAVACLVVTASGRILVLWDQDDTLPFRYPQLAMLLASLFNFAQSQSFGHLELQSGFTVLISSDVDAQVSVAVICAPSSPESHDNVNWSAEFVPLQLGRWKSSIILHEFVRHYRREIERLRVESVEQAKLKADAYTLTSALDGFHDGCDGTLDEFLAFQTDFVGLVMETTARGIRNSIRSWSHEVAAIMAQSSLATRLARGFVLNAETGDAVYSTLPGSHGSFFDQDAAGTRLHHLYKSARVQQLVKLMAKALQQSASVLIQLVQDDNDISDAAVVVRFKHLSGLDVSELFVALRTLQTGVFSTGIVFYGDNAVFRGRESDLHSSGRLQQTLAAHVSGKCMLNVLHDPAVDIELQVGSDGAPNEVWRAMDRLVRPLPLRWSEPDKAKSLPGDEPLDVLTLAKENATPRQPQLIE